MNCRLCIFRTTIDGQVSRTAYSHIAGRDITITIPKEAKVSACGKNPGKPVEIPEDRVACSECRERAQDQDA